MSHSDPRLHQNPGDRPKAVEELQSITASIRSKGEKVLCERMTMITFKETILCAVEPTSFAKPIWVVERTGSMESQIGVMHLEVNKMETNITTKEQHNIFTEKYMLALPNRGTPLK
jgi:hypothetical protein